MPESMQLDEGSLSLPAIINRNAVSRVLSIPLNSSEQESPGIFSRGPEATYRRVGCGGYSRLDGEKAAHKTRHQVRTVEVPGANHICGNSSRAKKILIRAQIGKDNSNACSRACILLLLSSSDSAQTVVRSSANTPFNFWRKGRSFRRKTICSIPGFRFDLKPWQRVKVKCSHFARLVCGPGGGERKVAVRSPR
jgi:hypothetical protein